ncbi:hypothetical protein EV356DRAFT_516412 [Viridothelium virens]|uniref:RNA ligase domain-containing protein n=1 Tax=Viridothelium virens TaxID=1048519 RepID=A0A6A6H7A5_VIRVR|nr:hypothetical protein EV356DRAFT_516412 [Viridothelium virens]
MSEETLYPKISGKPAELVKRLGQLGLAPGKVELIGTVKLHGAHADILVNRSDEVWLQSRNVSSLNAKIDIYGFDQFMKPLKNVVLDLKRQYIARYGELNPETTIDGRYPLIIAGEWIGHGIQNRVAISQLDRRFVIVSVSINNTWQPDEHYANIYDEAAGIYNISRAGFYYQTLFLNPPDNESKPEQDASFAAMQVHTEEIDKHCPFAATFGLSGVGEGIVWKVRMPPLHSNPETWFKTKGRTHNTPTVKMSARGITDGALMTEKAAAFAEQVVTPRRLQQGFEYLREMSLSADKFNTGAYMNWVQRDIFEEEKMDIQNAGIDEKILSKEIGKIAKRHFAKNLIDD